MRLRTAVALAALALPTFLLAVPASAAPAYWDDAPSYACSNNGCQWWDSATGHLLVRPSNLQLDWTQFIALPNHTIEFASNHSECLQWNTASGGYVGEGTCSVQPYHEWEPGPTPPGGPTWMTFFGPKDCMTGLANEQITGKTSPMVSISSGVSS